MLSINNVPYSLPWESTKTLSGEIGRDANRVSSSIQIRTERGRERENQDARKTKRQKSPLPVMFNYYPSLREVGRDRPS